MATRYTSLRRSILPLSSWVGGDWSTIPSPMGQKMFGIGAKLPCAEFKNFAARKVLATIYKDAKS
jgi:hypothetical protein